ncbi:MAG: hypothetical protein QXU18_12235 [Thermoplasmatales archaeon]
MKKLVISDDKKRKIIKEIIRNVTGGILSTIDDPNGLTVAVDGNFP